MNVWHQWRMWYLLLYKFYFSQGDGYSANVESVQDLSEAR